MEIRLKDAIKAGDSVAVSITGVVNPGPGNISDFKVYTTTNATAGLPPSYTIDTVAESMNDGGCLTPVTCYSPQAFRAAYGISPLLARGIDGKGRTVLIIEQADVPSDPAVTNVFQSLWAYDTYFHLPAVKLTVVAGTAAKASADRASFGEVMDVEVAHAVAPGAAIRVLVGDFDSNQGSVGVATLEAIRSASKGADVVADDSWAPEDCFSPSQLAAAHSVISQLAAQHITVVATDGNLGPALQTCTEAPCPTCSQKTVAKKGVYYPASDPLVLAVGGTTLTANPKTGAYTGEVAWNVTAGGHLPALASGGGFSGDFARPSYQDGVAGTGPYRGVPDVAADANGFGGLALVNEFGSGDSPQVQTGIGTNEGVDLWAGLVALADQYAGHDLGPIGPAIYRIGEGTQYHAAFHDITSGDNTYVVAGKTVEGYKAGPGWDPVTGWGTPIASVLVPLLARYDGS
jgi:subtilase family serine protease